jgi:hypothetical protein
LVHAADKASARAGETVIFTAWVTNASKSYLRNIQLIPRSFTNEAMEELAYSAKPTPRELHFNKLAPGERAMRSFSYLVTTSDHAHGGTLVSAMQVRAHSLGRLVTAEHDAIVSLADTPSEWPFRSYRRGLGYWSSKAVSTVRPRRRPRVLSALRD